MTYSTCFIRGLMMTGVSLALTACAGLHNVDHKWCPPEVEANTQPSTESISLNADVLFKFDRSGINDVLQEGRTELDKLVEQLNSYTRIDAIELVGHTDRLGSQAYNQQLSQARADTIMHYFRSRGVTAPMTAVGKGKDQPVTTDCAGEKATAELIACLQPDRRVQVIILGIRSQ